MECADRTCLDGTSSFNTLDMHSCVSHSDIDEQLAASRPVPLCHDAVAALAATFP